MDNNFDKDIINLKEGKIDLTPDINSIPEENPLIDAIKNDILFGKEQSFDIVDILLNSKDLE
jgi:hypothetical protein